MFRFLHTADIHLDSPLEGLEVYEGAPVESLRDATRRAFENLIRMAIDEAVDFVLIAGDLYDGDWKDFGTGLFFTRQMVQLQAAGIPVYLIAGNHDAASVLTRHLTLPDNVTVFSTRAVESKRVSGLPVVVHGRGFPNRAVPENWVPDYPRSFPGLFNIGLLHTSLAGAPGHDTYAPCSLRELSEKGYDYWALGHVHQPQVLSRDPWVVYPGNLQGRHARESGPRGCQLVKVSESLDVVDASHRPIDVVRWEKIGLDVSTCTSEGEVLDRVGEALVDALTRAGGRLLAARLVLAGSTFLHGRFKRDPARLKAECVAQSQVAGLDDIWIEEVRVETTDLADLADLSARDDLTRTVLETLTRAGAGEMLLPAETADMFRVLPAEIRAQVEAELADAERGALLADVRAIVLDALGRRGGQP